MPTFAAPALNGAWQGGIDNLMRLKALADSQKQEAGQADFINYLLQQNQPSAPTALNPPPGQSGQAQTAPTGPGPGPGPSPTQTPGGAAAPAGTQAPSGAAPTDGAPAAGGGGSSMVPGSIMSFVQAIKAQNPKASPKEVMDALETAMPFMDAQQKQQLAVLKGQVDLLKAKDNAQHHRTMEGIDKEKADAYRDHMAKLDPAQRMAEGRKILSDVTTIRNNLKYWQNRLLNDTDAAQKQKDQQNIDKLQNGLTMTQQYYSLWQSSLAGSAGAQFESQNPPPSEPDEPEPTDGGASQSQ